jgi:hypothetical protein
VAVLRENFKRRIEEVFMEDSSRKVLPIPSEAKTAAKEVYQRFLTEVDTAETAHCVVCVGRDETSRRELSRRRHDLQNAVRTLNYTLEGLRRGYHYDDSDAPAKIEALNRAATTLQREVACWMELLSGGKS